MPNLRHRSMGKALSWSIACGARGDLDSSEVAHGFAQHVDGFSQAEVERWNGPNALGVGELHIAGSLLRCKRLIIVAGPAFLPLGSGRVDARSHCSVADVMGLVPVLVSKDQRCRQRPTREQRYGLR